MKTKSEIMCFSAIFSSNRRDYFVGQYLSFASRAGTHKHLGSLIDRYRSNSLLSLVVASERRCTTLHGRSDNSQRSCLLRFYSSDSNGKNAGEDMPAPAKDVAKSDEHKENKTDRMSHGEAQAQLGEQDQMEGLETEKPSVENEKKKTPFLTRGARFRDEFLRRVVPWEEITDSWDTFPYYIHECTKNLLLECMASHLKHKKLTRDYGCRLASSSGRILLQSVPGTGLYQDRLVRALARDLQVPLLVLDSRVLPPYDFSQGESDEESAESDEEITSESEVDDESGSSCEEEDTSSGEESTDGSDGEVDTQTSAETCKKVIPYNCEVEKSVSEESESSSSSSKSETAKSSEKAVCLLKEGDRVKYVGPTTSIKANNRTLSSGRRGEVHEVNGDKVAVIFYISGLATKEAEKDEKGPETAAEPPVHWLDVKHIEHDPDAQTHDCYVAMEVLCEVLQSQQPIVVYFPDSFWWLSRAASRKIREEFVCKVKEMFDLLSGRMVLICGQNKWEAGSKEMENFPPSLKQLIKGLKATKQSEEDEIRKLFANVVCIKPPKEEDLLKTFCKQIEDRKTVISGSNLSEMHKVLKEHDLLCMDLEHVNTDGVILKKQKAEKIVGWATNHYLSSCHLPSVKEDRLHVPSASLELAILRLKEQEAESKNKPSQCLKNLARGYERSFVSAVVHPGEIGVKFDDVGALEDVKKVLNELVILPMRQPELFSHGNLLRPCKGILLFGPPGTGKTLLAKALATEAGANFISVTPSSFASKWVGDDEKLTRALFSFAGKLAPLIIFMDEVDALLGTRGGCTEHGATRRMRNEFMRAWDGLRSKDSQRILILGATNRPFDLDDAVLRRMPRRICVDLPDVENRLKILKVLLAQENMESGFSFEQLAKSTEGYSGSDLKVTTCVAAANRPLHELLQEESKGDRVDGVPALRPLKLDDFIDSKAKVGPSVECNSTSLNELRKWNEQYCEGGSTRKSWLQNLATDSYERTFVSAVVCPGEIGVKFDDVGALEDVKKALDELVILPMRRPELFSHGNLLRPCKGILLFGPPGTGKTLLVKALATEAGANFISVTPSSFASKWVGDDEKLTRALFSFAGKLAPVIIFLDEVDALLGARGRRTEHEATRRLRNEFMAAWDGLRSKDNQRILILGATNRPYDIDDAVIRCMPRRIYVDLPDVGSRLKILKLLLAEENLESVFLFEQLAKATEGYSGSDLKNLCVAAAYRPVQELLVEESKGDRVDGVPALRPLKLDDFTHCKAKVGPSVAYNSTSLNELREWNEQYGEGGSRRKSPFGF
ncbi:hypothetical protein Pfo_020757 [Paulownia fortunei]|nr:hypothetical protein Pfo_020757 [Paulownia fortunei]